MNLIQGNCLVELKKLENKSVDFVFLDLPYGQTACAWDKKIDLDSLWIELKRIAKNDRTPFFFTTTTKFGYELIKANEKWFRWDLVWKKNRAAGFLNAYRLPMRKHEMIYCFAKKCPAYDVSSHSEYVEVSENRIEPKTEVYGLDRGKTHKLHKEPLPTSICPPQEEHELIYCFAKKSPAYDVSSHKFHYENNPRPRKTEIYGMNDDKKIKAKIFDDPLPTSVIPPQEEHELIYCFAKKCPDYDVSSHLTGEEKDKANNTKWLLETANKGDKIYTSFKKDTVKGKVINEPLPTSICPPQEEEPSSWCEFSLDNKTGHRTAKPIKLMEYLLKYWSKEGDTILDPTMGSGSMGIACKNMNRKFIGIELNEDIYQLAQKRIQDTKEVIKQEPPLEEQ